MKRLAFTSLFLVWLSSVHAEEPVQTASSHPLGMAVFALVIGAFALFTGSLLWKNERSSRQKKVPIKQL